MYLLTKNVKIMRKQLLYLLTVVSMMLVCGVSSAWAQTEVTVGVTRTVDGTSLGDITAAPTTGDITAEWVIGSNVKSGNNKKPVFMQNGTKTSLVGVSPVWGTYEVGSTYDDNRYIGTKITIASGKQFNVSEIHALIASDNNGFTWKITIENENGTVLFSNSDQKTTAGGKSGSDTYDKTSFGEEAKAKLSGLKGTIYLKIYYYNTASNTKYITPITLQLKGSVEEAAAATKCEAPGGKWGTFNFETLTYPLTLSTTDGSSIKYSTDGTNFNDYTEPIAVSPNAEITAYSYDTNGTLENSDNEVFTAAAAPACPQPTYVLSTYNSNTKEYTLTFSHEVTNAKIYTKVGNEAEALYEIPLSLIGGETVTAYAVLEGTPNSEQITINIPTAPEAVGMEYTTAERGYSYRLEEGYGGKSSNNNINNGVKLNSASIDGFNLLVNETFIITDLSVKISPNGGKDCIITGVYVDVNPEDIATAEPVKTNIEMPNDQITTFDLQGINAKKNVFFAVAFGEGTAYKQANMYTAVNYQFENYTKSYTLAAEDTEFYGLYLDYAATIPTGVTAYTGVLSDDESTLKVTKIDGDVLPANCAVLVKAADTGEYTFEASDATVEGIASDLKGVTANTNVTDLAETGKIVLTLGVKDGVIGFRQPAGAQIMANKAYLLVSEVNAAKGVKIAFGGETTGISEINSTADKANEAVYDLTGRRVSADAKGLLIKNGKKFINK